MILFVLSIAIMNFGLGFALAVMLSDAPLVSSQLLHRLRVAAAGTPPEPPLPPPTATLDDLPTAWMEQLTAANLPVTSFWQGLLLKLWVEVAPFREELLSAEVRARLALSRLDQGVDLALVTDCQLWQARWQQLLLDAHQLLEPRLDVLDIDQAAGEQLDQQLEQQLTRLKQSMRELAEVDIEKEPELGLRQLQTVLRESIDQLHRHRDGVQTLLAARLRGSELIASGQPLYLDPLTGQISRMGAENLFELWFKEDPQRLRLVSCALVDIDRLARFNDRLGHRAGDRFLCAITELLANGIRTDRGYDRMARFSGQQFLLFFGDTGPKNAASALERIRQSFEATTLDYEGNEHDVTISAGIAAIRREDTLDKFYARLQAALRNAKIHGRNRTSVDDGDGPEPLLAPMRYSVRAKHVRIESH